MKSITLTIDTVTKTGQISDEDFAMLIAAGQAKYGADKTADEVLTALIAEAVIWLQNFPLRAVPRQPMMMRRMAPPPPMLDGKPVAPITVNTL